MSLLRHADYTGKWFDLLLMSDSARSRKWSPKTLDSAIKVERNSGIQHVDNIPIPPYGKAKNDHLSFALCGTEIAQECANQLVLERPVIRRHQPLPHSHLRRVEHQFLKCADDHH